MADFFEEGGAAALGQGIKGFAQGWQDAEDRKMKRMEMDAKAEAQRFDRERNRFLDGLTMRDRGFQAPAGKDLYQVESSELIEKPKAAPSGPKPIKDDPLSSELRTKWMNDPTTKATKDMAASYGKIQKISQSPSAAGDISLVFNFMKMNDPGSTVREGEYATAQNAAGVPEQLRNQYNKLKDGQFLDPKQRADFLNQARNLYASQLEQQRVFGDSLRGLAQRRGLRGEDIVLDDMFVTPQAVPMRENVQLRGTGPQPNPQGLLNVGRGLVSPGLLQAPQAADAGGPKPGEVQGGYEFLGGDPADQKNWKKVETKSARK